MRERSAVAIVAAILPDRGDAMQGEPSGRAAEPARAAKPAPTSSSTPHNPVDWYPWGEEAIARARAERQADPALDRLFRLPLVPRDGARVLRGRGDGGGHEPPVRQRQGGPRGAARPRQGLPARAPDADAARRRLAAHDVPRARRPHAVLRRHLLPEAGRATACRPSRTCSSASPGSTANERAERRVARTRRCAACSTSSCRRPRPTGARDHARADRRARGSASPPASTRASAASGRRRSFRTPRRSSSCCARGRRRHGGTRPRARHMAT